LLRQGDLVIIAVVVFRHLGIPLTYQLSFSSMKVLAEAKQRRAGQAGARAVKIPRG
jgi:hypothetical protein